MSTFLSPTSRPIAICSDHAGYPLKCAVIEFLESQGLKCHDFGTHSPDSCDYPDFAHPCGKGLDDGEFDFAIAICGTGNGIAMTLNKHQGVRAALCWLPEIASLSRAHNDANCLVLPGRFVTPEVAMECVKTFFSTPFEGGRHARRVAKIPLFRQD